jgi:hypothetical protein
MATPDMPRTLEVCLLSVSYLFLGTSLVLFLSPPSLPLLSEIATSTSQAHAVPACQDFLRASQTATTGLHSR